MRVVLKTWYRILLTWRRLIWIVTILGPRVRAWTMTMRFLSLILVGRRSGLIWIAT